MKPISAMKNASVMLHNMGKILHNRLILYFILFLAIVDLIILAVGNEFMLISVFLLTGFVTTFFSKNMMVVMCTSIVITNIMQYGTDIRMNEGFKGEQVEDKKTEAAKPAAAKPALTPSGPKETLNNLSDDEAKDLVENMDKMKEIEPIVSAINKLITNFQTN